ncbi:ATP-grasp domain-containing protein [Priestia megaterium]|uniref:ATP-grasp domain-containing protein n=1 Tax=Priestia megaterium TaxID=1404 RepID=UPI0020798B32|nr:ATP-grasp domain-containing protein [Priestia megaterium]USL45557.1 ATP-grasp domain-containing protein [Priestia megaterium]
MNKKVIAIIEAGHGRENAFVSLHKEGYYILFVTRTKVKPSKYIDEILHIDTNSTEDLLKTLKQYTEQKQQIDCVITLLEWYVPITAEICEVLGLLGISKKTAENCRNKHAMRLALEKQGVPIPLFKLCKNKMELEDAVDYVGGYPCIIKPIDGTGSSNVVKVNNQTEIFRAFEDIQAVKRNSREQELKCIVLVEEYIEGNEFSLDSITINGKTEILAICDYQTTNGPYFVEMAYTTPSQLSGELQDQIKAAAKEAIRAVDIKNGVSHCEVKLTANGPVVIEIAARHGGGHIPEVIELTTGINYYVEAVKLFCGQQVNISPRKNISGAMSLIFPEETGTVSDILNVDKARETECINEIVISAKIGDQVFKQIKDYKSPIGYVIASGETPAKAIQQANLAKDTLAIKYN